MKLFGLDIAGLVAENFAGQLLPVTLTRKTPGEYDPIAGDNWIDGTTETYTSEGIVSEYADELKATGLVHEKHRKILIIAKPLGTAPRAGDKVTIEGVSYTVTGVPSRDPAGATWTIKGEL